MDECKSLKEGHRFTTSLQTLTAVPDCYFASMFSGRFQLHPDAEGVYFIDRTGTHFSHILDYLRDPGSFLLSPATLGDKQKAELAIETKFYGLVDHRMTMPYYSQEQIGVSLLERAGVAGTKKALRAAVAQARALVVEMGSTSPWLTDRFQDVRYLITDRVVNDVPVWTAEHDKNFMFRTVKNTLVIGDDGNCAEGEARGWIHHTQVLADFLTPTMLSSTGWMSGKTATLSSQYASAGGTGPATGVDGEKPWVAVPNMRVTAVHGLPDDEPAMASALRQLATLT